MNNGRSWLIAALAAVGVSGPGAAQNPVPAPPPAVAPAAPDPSLQPAARDTLDAADDIALLRALAPLQLSRSQLAQLLPLLESTQAKLTGLEHEEAERRATQRPALEQARRDLLAGKGTGARAQEQFVSLTTTAAQRRAGLRAELVASLRRALTTLLTGPQTAQLAQGGQAALLSQRLAGWRGGGPGSGGPGGRSPGAPGASGSGNPALDRLDRIRAMSPAEYDTFLQRRPGGRNGQNPDAAQRYLSLLDQVRNMPHSQYLLQREQLAARMQGLGGRGPGGASDPETASNAFVERYLLSPRAPGVVRSLLQAQ
jgi:hypothetical protein